jgi:hypothetical protein
MSDSVGILKNGTIIILSPHCVVLTLKKGQTCKRGKMQIIEITKRNNEEIEDDVVTGGKTLMMTMHCYSLPTQQITQGPLPCHALHGSLHGAMKFFHLFGSKPLTAFQVCSLHLIEFMPEFFKVLLVEMAIMVDYILCPLDNLLFLRVHHCHEHGSEYFFGLRLPNQ